MNFTRYIEVIPSILGVLKVRINSLEAETEKIKKAVIPT